MVVCGAGLRIIAAAEPFAEAAIGAGPEPDAERVHVSLRHVAGGLRKRLVAELARSLCEQRMAEGLRLRRIGIGPRARPLEGIPAFVDLPFQIAGGARRPAKILELVVVWLEIVVGDAPVLDRHVRREKMCAISLRQMRLKDEIRGQEAPCLRVPVDPPAADAVHRHERAPAANRQRLLIHFVAKSEGELLRPQEELMPDAIAQFVLVVGGREFGRRIAPWPALDGDDVETLVGQLVGQDRARPAQADDRHVLPGELPRHCLGPQVLRAIQSARPMKLTGGWG